jgi:hypothetical protein
MVAPEGRDYPPYVTLRAAEALVRSLVGVAGVSGRADADGVLSGLTVVPEPGISDRRIGRDVQSAIKARFGVSLDSGAITIAAPATETEVQRPLVPDWPVSSIPAAGRDREHRPDEPKRNGNENGAGRSALSTPTAEPVSSPSSGLLGTHALEPGHRDPLPALESATVEPLERGLRCRITIGLGEERFHGVAEVPAGFTAEAELAARVTLDALRSARTPPEPLQFLGVSLIDLAGRPHVVVSLGLWKGNEFEPLAGAEPVRSSVADAAARAVLGSVQPYFRAAVRPCA